MNWKRRRCSLCGDWINYDTEEVSWGTTSVPTGNRYGVAGRKTVKTAVHAESVGCRDRYVVREEIPLTEVKEAFAAYPPDEVPDVVFNIYFGTKNGRTVKVDEANESLIVTRPMTNEERATARAEVIAPPLK